MLERFNVQSCCHCNVKHNLLGRGKNRLLYSQVCKYLDNYKFFVILPLHFDTMDVAKFLLRVSQVLNCFVGSADHWSTKTNCESNLRSKKKNWNILKRQSQSPDLQLMGGLCIKKAAFHKFSFYAASC